MKFFLDTANLEEIKRIVKLGLVNGITTNPSIIAKEGADFKTRIQEICALVSGPVSAEVIGLTAEEMINEGRDCFMGREYCCQNPYDRSRFRSDLSVD